jgi:hypothetical protein
MEASMKRLVSARGPRALAFVLITFLPLVSLGAREEESSPGPPPSAPCPSIQLWANPPGGVGTEPEQETDEIWTEFSVDGVTWSRSEVPGWRYYRVRVRDASGETSTIEERRANPSAPSSRLPDGTILV